MLIKILPRKGIKQPTSKEFKGLLKDLIVSVEIEIFNRSTQKVVE